MISDLMAPKLGFFVCLYLYCTATWILYYVLPLTYLFYSSALIKVHFVDYSSSFGCNDFIAYRTMYISGYTLKSKLNNCILIFVHLLMNQIFTDHNMQSSVLNPVTLEFGSKTLYNHGGINIGRDKDI